MMPSCDVGAIFAQPGTEIAEEEHRASLTELEDEPGEGMPPLTSVHRGVAGCGHDEDRRGGVSRVVVVVAERRCVGFAAFGAEEEGAAVRVGRS